MKTCPFCGSNRVISGSAQTDGDMSSSVMCGNCGAQGPEVKGKAAELKAERAIERAEILWNVRKEHGKVVDLEAMLYAIHYWFGDCKVEVFLRHSSYGDHDPVYVMSVVDDANGVNVCTSEEKLSVEECASDVMAYVFAQK